MFLIGKLRIVAGSKPISDDTVVVDKITRLNRRFETHTHYCGVAINLLQHEMAK